MYFRLNVPEDKFLVHKQRKLIISCQLKCGKTYISIVLTTQKWFPLLEGLFIFFCFDNTDASSEFHSFEFALQLRIYRHCVCPFKNGFRYAGLNVLGKDSWALLKKLYINRISYDIISTWYLQSFANGSMRFEY